MAIVNLVELEVAWCCSGSKIASCGVAYYGRGLASSLLIDHDDDVHHPAGQSLIGLRIVWPQFKV